MAIFKYILRYRRGDQNGTTEADIASLLADDTERARLEKEAKETILLLRKLVIRDPQATAYTIAAGNDFGDMFTSYALALSALNWVLPLYRILVEHPIIKDREPVAADTTGEKGAAS